ncbi:MAG: hypothetical protein WA755_19245 [Candidatus Acidiferrales bacterium]
MRKYLILLAVTLCASTAAKAQIHPENSLLATASPSLAPAIPGGGAAADDQTGGSGRWLIGRSYSDPIQFQASVNYAWTRFEAFSNNKFGLNGFDASLTMYIKGMGFEGQLIGGMGDPNGVFSKLAFAGGGVHYRFREGRKLEPWAHILVGRANFEPQTAYGHTGSFGWEVGGGVDYRVLPWISLRGGANALGTRLYSTNQVNPEIFTGFVINF